ncbi:MAG TPA: maleylpyruvate isomerase family mycothiol-dependent enzyme [Motilibacterales bacterium]|nr:maleylpyruvate isomerase family mycothiol-dependent enzyme [Motilibacterales bacterium]
MVDFDAVLAFNSMRFREVVAGSPPGSPVPSCPGWSSADLLSHLTEVQSFWGEVVTSRLQDGLEVGAIVAPPRRDEPEAALAQFDAVSERLRSGLAAARDDEPAWTWTPDHTIGWIRRRQAQEALVHRVDAELAAGLSSEVDPEAAEDGVDEVLTQFGAALPEWGSFDPSGLLVAVRSTPSGQSWGVRLGRFRGVDPDGIAHDEPDYQPVTHADDRDPPVTHPDDRAEAVLEGTAVDLLLWLWGRADGEGISATGDPSARSSLRAAITANTQ